MGNWVNLRPREISRGLSICVKSNRRTDLNGVSAVFEDTRNWELRDIATISWALTQLRQKFPVDGLSKRFEKLAKNGKAKGVDWAQMSVAVAAGAQPDRALAFFDSLANWLVCENSKLSPADIIVLISSLNNFH